MRAEFRPIKTADGSDTLFSAQMNESYHSLNGAVQESKHVFIEAGLRRINQHSIQIFEVGFGTGLNALLTWQEARQSCLNISYDSIEAFPLDSSCYETLNYPALLPGLIPGALNMLHECKWNEVHLLEKNRFQFRKILQDFTSFAFDITYDLIYFDAFAPDKQPAIWEESQLRKCHDALKPGGILVTYCAKGEIRRQMQKSGFQTERLPGPPGKREMLRAIRQE